MSVKITKYSNMSYDECRAFYKTYEWRQCRRLFLEGKKLVCASCSTVVHRNPTDDDDRLNVDHIRPIKYFWDQRLDPKNLQILCSYCNREKGNRTRTPTWKDVTNADYYREEEQKRQRAIRMEAERKQKTPYFLDLAMSSPTVAQDLIDAFRRSFHGPSYTKKSTSSDSYTRDQLQIYINYLGKNYDILEKLKKFMQA